MSSTNAPTPGSAKALLAAGARCEHLLGRPVYGMEALERVQPEGQEKDCRMSKHRAAAPQPLQRTSRGVLATLGRGGSFRPRHTLHSPKGPRKMCC